MANFRCQGQNFGWKKRRWTTTQEEEPTADEIGQLLLLLKSNKLLDVTVQRKKELEEWNGGDHRVAAEDLSSTESCSLLPPCYPSHASIFNPLVHFENQQKSFKWQSQRNNVGSDP